jgi:TonB-linked SusC/RagA family outer membrane protein
MTLTAAYSKNFGEHHLRVLTGYEFLKSYTEFSASKSRDYSMESFIYHKLNAGAIQNVESGAWGSSLASYFGRLSYDYAGKYLLEVNLRADGASNFTPENRWGYFPSVAAGWLLSEEAFMESTKKWLANLKVRVSYGETGNYNVGDHTMDYYGVMPWTGWATMFGNTMRIGTEAKGIGNPDITWETTSELNIGLDIGLLKNRITLTAEYFNREIRDLLNELPLMYYFDVNHIYGNIGKTQSRGFEITINTVNFDKKDFDWHTTVTLSHYEDRWKERSPLWRPRGYEKADDYLRPVFDHEAIGILQPGDLPPDYQPTLIPGYVILKNQDGDDKITEDGDKVLLGTADPYLIFGVNNALRYKNLDFSVYFYGEAGALRNGSYMENMASVDGSRNMSLYALNTFSYDNLNATRPSLLAKGIPKGNWDMQKIFFIRCGNIKLGYTIPISKKIVSKLHAYVSVDNAFVLTNWIGLDPETDNIAFSYPNVRSYTLGINISF